MKNALTVTSPPKVASNSRKNVANQDVIIVGSSSESSESSSSGSSSSGSSDSSSDSDSDSEDESTDAKSKPVLQTPRPVRKIFSEGFSTSRIMKPHTPNSLAIRKIQSGYPRLLPQTSSSSPLARKEIVVNTSAVPKDAILGRKRMTSIEREGTEKTQAKDTKSGSSHTDSIPLLTKVAIKIATARGEKSISPAGSSKNVTETQNSKGNAKHLDGIDFILGTKSTRKKSSKSKELNDKTQSTSKVTKRGTGRKGEADYIQSEVNELNQKSGAKKTSTRIDKDNTVLTPVTITTNMAGHIKSDLSSESSSSESSSDSDTSTSSSSDSDSESDAQLANAASKPGLEAVKLKTEQVGHTTSLSSQVMPSDGMTTGSTKSNINTRGNSATLTTVKILPKVCIPSKVTSKVTKAPPSKIVLNNERSLRSKSKMSGSSVIPSSRAANTKDLRESESSNSDESMHVTSTSSENDSESVSVSESESGSERQGESESEIEEDIPNSNRSKSRTQQVAPGIGLKMKSNPVGSTKNIHSKSSVQKGSKSSESYDEKEVNAKKVETPRADGGNKTGRKPSTIVPDESTAIKQETAIRLQVVKKPVSTKSSKEATIAKLATSNRLKAQNLTSSDSTVKNKAAKTKTATLVSSQTLDSDSVDDPVAAKSRSRRAITSNKNYNDKASASRHDSDGPQESESESSRESESDDTSGSRGRGMSKSETIPRLSHIPTPTSTKKADNNGKGSRRAKVTTGEATSKFDPTAVASPVVPTNPLKRSRESTGTLITEHRAKRPSASKDPTSQNQTSDIPACDDTVHPTPLSHSSRSPLSDSTSDSTIPSPPVPEPNANVNSNGVSQVRPYEYLLSQVLPNAPGISDPNFVPGLLELIRDSVGAKAERNMQILRNREELHTIEHAGLRELEDLEMAQNREMEDLQMKSERMMEDLKREQRKRREKFMIETKYEESMLEVKLKQGYKDMNCAAQQVLEKAISR